MKEMRMIRLINDERTLLSVKKVSACDATSYDGGCEIYDLGDSPCPKDICIICQFPSSVDYCFGEADVRGCSGPSETDVCFE